LLHPHSSSKLSNTNASNSLAHLWILAFPPGIMRAATGFEPSDKWFGQQAVYRISMGNFLFFGGMSLALLGVKYKGEKRGQLLQHGNWVIKLVVWILFNALPFLFPNGMVQAYGACSAAQHRRSCGSTAQHSTINSSTTTGAVHRLCTQRQHTNCTLDGCASLAQQLHECCHLGSHGLTATGLVVQQWSDFVELCAWGSDSSSCS
jgi:hypothetical protein